MLAAAPSVTPIAVALVLSLVAFGAFLPWIVRDSRQPLPPPRVPKPARVRVRERPPDVVDTAQVPEPARRAAITLAVLGAAALWATFGARTRRSARR